MSRAAHLKIVDDVFVRPRPEKIAPAGVADNLSKIPQISIDKLIDLGYGRSMRGEVSAAPKWEAPLTDFVQHLRARKLSPNSIGIRSYQIRHVSRYFLDREPWSVTTRDLEVVLGAEHWSRDTARSNMNAWKSFFDFLIATHDFPIHDNPVAGLGTISATRGRPRPAPVDAIAEAVAKAPDRVRLMIYLGAEVGLRRAEIAGIHTRDLFLDADGGMMLRVLGKGSKIRELPLSDRIAGLLRDIPAGWVFPSHHRGIDDGTPAARHIGPIRVGELVREALPAGVTTHMLRHRFASEYYKATGYNIRAVQEMLGHSSVATTQIYTEVPKSTLRAGMNAMRTY